MRQALAAMDGTPARRNATDAVTNGARTTGRGPRICYPPIIIPACNWLSSSARIRACVEDRQPRLSALVAALDAVSGVLAVFAVSPPQTPAFQRASASQPKETLARLPSPSRRGKKKQNDEEIPK
ncbi:hypothetical protein MTO96_016242 [Rhipicephalus appendiculatus]